MTPVPRVLGIREFVDGETKLQNNSSLMKGAYFEKGRVVETWATLEVWLSYGLILNLPYRIIKMNTAAHIERCILWVEILVERKPPLSLERERKYIYLLIFFLSRNICNWFNREIVFISRLCVESRQMNYLWSPVYAVAYRNVENIQASRDLSRRLVPGSFFFFVSTHTYV